MLQIKNISKVDQPFVTGRDDNGPKVESVPPGAIRSLNVSETAPDVVGRLHAGVIVIVDSGKKAKASEPSTAS